MSVLIQKFNESVNDLIASKCKIVELSVAEDSYVVRFKKPGATKITRRTFRNNEMKRTCLKFNEKVANLISRGVEFVHSDLQGSGFEVRFKENGKNKASRFAVRL